ncbi:YceI family protein [Algoriphagus formosus]|uniref:YceI family protein n=1 Tax=Algoriphagus formosus TaxID=2007308 RepID=A0A4R5V269_9BACT|nr:YceI family protein [Algoriphagus aquimaris]TDK45575.1 YceI family protein [Algoriphagus aquimaris]
MKSIINLFMLIFFLHVGEVYAQTLYGTTLGEVSLYSDTPIETIQAVNKKSGAILNSSNRELVVQMKITEFVFPNKLMQEHFNENYMESERYPTATFKGKIKEQVDLETPGTYPVTAEGSLTIHGVSKPVTVKGQVVSNGTELKLDFKFQVKPEEYQIEIPSLVITKIAELIDISGKMSLAKR